VSTKFAFKFPELLICFTSYCKGKSTIIKKDEEKFAWLTKTRLKRSMTRYQTRKAMIASIELSSIIHPDKKTAHVIHYSSSPSQKKADMTDGVPRLTDR
jgi:hypothetical protein